MSVKQGVSISGLCKIRFSAHVERISNMRTTLVFIALTTLAACPADDDPGLGVDSQAVCDCPAPTAATTSYDNTGSGLSGADVQDAVDELAARPQPGADVMTRIEVVEVTTTSTTPALSGTEGERASCPEGGKAIGGGCDLDDVSLSSYPGLALEIAELADASYNCLWHKPAEAQATFKTKVVCLMPAEQ